MASQPVTHHPLTAVTLMTPLGCSSSEICRRHSIYFPLTMTLYRNGRTVVGLLIPTAQVHSSNLCPDQTTLMFVVLGIQGHCEKVCCDGYLLCCIIAPLLHPATVTSGQAAEVLEDNPSSWSKEVTHKCCKTQKCNLLLVLFGGETWCLTLTGECRITAYWETYLGPRARKWHDTGKNCIVRSFTTCIHEMILWPSNQGGWRWVGHVARTGKKWTRYICWVNLNEKETLENLSADRRRIF